MYIHLSACIFTVTWQKMAITPITCIRTSLIKNSHIPSLSIACIICLLKCILAERQNPPAKAWSPSSTIDPALRAGTVFPREQPIMSQNEKRMKSYSRNFFFNSSFCFPDSVFILPTYWQICTTDPITCITSGLPQSMPNADQYRSKFWNLSKTLFY